MKKLLAILLCLALVVGCFAGCGQSAGSGTTFRKMYSGEVTTMNYLVTGSTNDLIIPANVIDTLVEYDAYGAIKPALAESWETSEDGLTWTFHLREGVKWYDYMGKEVAPVTAQDFVDAAIYALDAKNASSTEYMMEGIIANATEYYKYTSYLLESENGTKTTDEDGEAIEPVAEVKPEDVGVKAVDDLTLEYTLVQPTPYFLSVLNYGCYLPANGAFMQSCIAEDGTDMFGTDNTKLLYNGAYILSTFEPQGRRIMTKNPNYWDKDNVFIDAIEETYNKEMDTIAPEMFKRNETDLAYLSADILDAWLAADDTKNMVSPSRVDSSYSYFYAFNFEPKFDEAYEPDNWTLAVNNENFRQSIFHALDRVKAKTVMQPYDPESFIINTVTPPNFTDLNGVDFSEVGDLAAISARDSFQSDKALEYKEKAVEELTAEGATFPVKVLMPYNPSSTNWDKECQVVEQQLEAQRKQLADQRAALEAQAAQTQQAAAAAEATVRTLEAQQTSENTLPPRELAALQARQTELQTVRSQLTAAEKALNARLVPNRNAAAQYRQHSARLTALEHRWQWVSALSATAGGTLSSKQKIRLEAYIQMNYLDRILVHANTRLMQMTAGQYELERIGAENQRSQSGLDLGVIDHYNGTRRSVKTLSGGESFKASLALALGLSDEVQSAAGGIRLDTLFLDEGFGSLDEDSLEQAIRVLAGLTEGDRLVGIISHVGALKDRIDHQIVVRKARSGGSTAELIV